MLCTLSIVTLWFLLGTGISSSVTLVEHRQREQHLAEITYRCTPNVVDCQTKTATAIEVFHQEDLNNPVCSIGKPWYKE